MKGCANCCARKECPFQSVKTWKSSADPEYAAKKARIDHLYAVADRAAEPAAGGTDAAAAPGDPEVVFCVDLCRVRAAEPSAQAGPSVGPPRRHPPGPGRAAPAAAARHLPPHRRGAAPVRGAGPGRRQDVRAREAAQEAGSVPGVLPLPAQLVPAAGAVRDHLRQSLPAPDHQERQTGRELGEGQQYRDRLPADQQLVDESKPSSPLCANLP
jgi:hypothetical protein